MVKDQAAAGCVDCGARSAPLGSRWPGTMSRRMETAFGAAAGKAFKKKSLQNGRLDIVLSLYLGSRTRREIHSFGWFVELVGWARCVYVGWLWGKG